MPHRKRPVRYGLLAVLICTLPVWQSIPRATGSEPVSKTCTVQLKLLQADSTGQLQSVPGVIRITSANGENFHPAELLNRGLGLKKRLKTGQTGIHDWSVLPGEVEIRLPRQTLTLEAFSGLETEQTRQQIDLTNQDKADIALTLKPFSETRKNHYRTANTHLHIMKLDRETCDRYLTEIPLADRLDIVFLSYLERAVADKTYISNHYTKPDLADLSKTSGVLFGNGEEHRHNMAGYGEGYGHVMLLNIMKLILPVSIGPGIMKMGTDGIPLARGIQAARKDKATIIWCHNAWGLESTPNFISGHVHALNIFDGGTRSTYEDSYYRYLNAGMRVPFSTGTDWFQYDFSRVYARLGKPLTVENWLESLRAGRTFITNGPLLDLEINEQTIGETIKLNQAGQSITIRASANSRVDFKKIELILDGKVIDTAMSNQQGNHYHAALNRELQVNKPGWIALRTPPPSVPNDPGRSAKTPLNEYGKELFSHTSPIYIEVAEQAHFDLAAARELLAEMQQNTRLIDKQSKFADPQERASVLSVYGEAIEIINTRIHDHNHRHRHSHNHDHEHK